MLERISGKKSIYIIYIYAGYTSTWYFRNYVRIVCQGVITRSKAISGKLLDPPFMVASVGPNLTGPGEGALRLCCWKVTIDAAHCRESARRCRPKTKIWAGPNWMRGKVGEIFREYSNWIGRGWNWNHTIMVLRLNNVTGDVFLWSMTHVCSHRCKSVAMGRNAAMSNFP